MQNTASYVFDTVDLYLLQLLLLKISGHAHSLVVEVSVVGDIEQCPVRVATDEGLNVREMTLTQFQPHLTI